MTPAPSVLFVYNRALLARQTLESLMKNELATESDLYIFSDGPKQDAGEGQRNKIKEVRKMIREQQWCKNVYIRESETNMGLAKSVISGVSEIAGKFGSVIVLEDDVVLSPFFLKFMNDGLQEYAGDEKVLSLGSWNYFCPPEKLNGETFFFRFPDCKGWATFDRAWKLFEADATAVLEKLEAQNKMDDFNAGLLYPYFTNMLKDQIEGRINSWAIRWTATAILHDKLNLFSRYTLSKDMGFGHGATHEFNAMDYNQHLEIHCQPVNVIHETIVEDQQAVKSWREFYTRYFIPDQSFSGKIRSKLRSLLPEKALEAYRRRRYGKQ
ncbi:MAG TPA: glycosyltransferase family A protein [Bacteroidia bacterium]|nr:glycosyltransferase family A protein [Bacteroidia bacterium]